MWFENSTTLPASFWLTLLRQAPGLALMLPMTPDDLLAQRVQWRKERIAARIAMSPAERAAADALLNAKLRVALAGTNEGVLAFYWPIPGEFDARLAVTGWLDSLDAPNGARRAVLPVVLARHQPLRFRAWTPATVMRPAGFGTPFGTQAPSAGEWLVPTVLVVPLVGFDDAAYRLGYGGGYYDRTLATLTPTPRTIGIGIGYAAGRLASIHPQSHDLKLDLLIVA